VVVAAAAGYAVFWPLSDLIARHDVGSITGPARAAALQTARDAARGRLVAFGAGLFAVGALVYTARNFSLARQGQVTDRYTKAIEQLGSDKGLDVRIGGIYALERIARDSPRDHPTIMEVLAAFIREHSREHWPPAEPGAEPPEHRTRPDVQAAATVIGRRTVRHDSQVVKLAGADLADAHLADTDFARAYLPGAQGRGPSALVPGSWTGAGPAAPEDGAVHRGSVRGGIRPGDAGLRDLRPGRVPRRGGLALQFIRNRGSGEALPRPVLRRYW